MRSRAVRVTLMLLTIAGFGAAGYFAWTVDRQSRTAGQAAATFDQTRITALRDAYELRSTQQAYVAAGQNETFWFGKATQLVESVRAAINTLRSSAVPAAALDEIDAALAAVDEFEQADRRARNYAASGQKLLASDVIFSAGLEAANGITTALEKAGTALTESSGRAAREALLRQAMALGGAIGFAIFALFLLTPLPSRASETPAIAATEPSSSGDTLMLREETKPPQRRVAATRDPREVQRRKVQNAPGSAPAPAPPPQSATVTPGVELQGLAAVCTDLARLSDTSRLPAILERAAVALDASGLVVWISDQDGAVLVPIASHGYPASVVSRIGTLRADGQNATAAAFRTGLVQTVPANASSNGAIAAPLLASVGCRGVMAAEVRAGAEKNPARLAVASILAAQLAALLGPPSTESTEDRTSALL